MKLLQLVGLLGENGLTVGVLFLSLIEVVRFASSWWKRRANWQPPPPIAPAYQWDESRWREFLEWKALREQGDIAKQRLAAISNLSRRRS